jgi:hypothetical protein
MIDHYRKRRVILFSIFIVVFAFIIWMNIPSSVTPTVHPKPKNIANTSLAMDVLGSLDIKGRAPKTNYSREQFGNGWLTTGDCDTRNIILNRDLTNVVVDDKCDVVSGTLNDPYTGKIIQFTRGGSTSSAIQIDHVVALSDAWQKGAQQFTSEKRIELANDPLELLAVDGPANLQKSDGDAATWLPPNKSFRCQYIARQIAVKQKYKLWVTQAEHNTMMTILDKCPRQMLPSL